MKGDAGVISRLNDYLKTELTGHHQYLRQAALLHNWGFRALAEREDAYSREETEHTKQIAARILLLEGVPNYQDIRRVSEAGTVKDMLTDDHALVKSAIDLLREAVEYCESVADFESRHLMVTFLDDEEEHLHWLEVQLGLIGKVGTENYLQSQM